MIYVSPNLAATITRDRGKYNVVIDYNNIRTATVFPATHSAKDIVDYVRNYLREAFNKEIRHTDDDQSLGTVFVYV